MASAALEWPREQLTALTTLEDLLAGAAKTSNQIQTEMHRDSSQFVYCGRALPWLHSVLARHSAHKEVAEKASHVLVELLNATPNKVLLPMRARLFLVESNHERIGVARAPGRWR